MDWNNYLFGFEGRINRAKMWLAVLIIVCWMIFLSGLAFAVGGLFGGLKSFSLGVNDIFLALDPAIYRSLTLTGLCIGIFKAIAISLFVWVYSATSIKRLHDRNKSGWWMMPFFVVPGLHSHFADRLPDSWLDFAAGADRLRALHLGFCRNLFPEGFAQDQPVRAEPAAAARHAAALGAGPRDRDGAA